MIMLDALDKDTHAPCKVELKFDTLRRAHVALESLPGATAVQIVLRDTDQIVMGAEIQVTGPELIRVEIREDTEGRLVVESGNRQVYFLPKEEPPSVLLLKNDPRERLDVAILVDVTAADVSDGSPAKLVPLIGGPQWDALAEKIIALIETIAKPYTKGVRTCLLTFSDGNGMGEGPVEPEFQFRALKSFDRPKLAAALKGLRWFSGGDFVDATAEGLEAVANLPWGDEARKLAILIGNSPGYSIEEALETDVALLDSEVRLLDVYEQADLLFGNGVSLATIFMPFTTARLANLVQLKLADVPRLQYERLATLQEWACTREFDLEAEAGRILAPPPLVARGPARAYVVG